MTDFIVSPMREHPERFYVCQIENPQEVENWENQPSSDDDLTKPEYNWCAMCCVKMIAKALTIQTSDLLEMYQTAFTKYDVYKMENGKVLGAYHKELADYIETELSLKAIAKRNLTVDDVKSIVGEDNFFIASVSGEISDLNVEPKRKKGHMVLVYGFNEQGFFIHNSAGFSRMKTQKNVLVPFEFFEKCFSRSGICVLAATFPPA